MGKPNPCPIWSGSTLEMHGMTNSYEDTQVRILSWLQNVGVNGDTTERLKGSLIIKKLRRWRVLTIVPKRFTYNTLISRVAELDRRGPVEGV